LLAQENTPLFSGSEFKKSSDLRKILHSHPLWDHTQKILDHGAHFPLQEIDSTTRESDNAYHQFRGNHKSAIENKETLQRLIAEDVSKAFALIMPLEIIPYMEKLSIAPLGCPEQGTINEHGERVSKHRMTHDQSFPGPSSLSVNKRVLTDKLPPSNVYGFALRRTIHYIVHLRHQNPNTKILISKFDFDAAYRRCHLSAATSTECCTIFNDFLYIHLRLTFGGSPCPTLWNAIAEPITDIANRLIQSPDWDHNLTSDPLSKQIETCHYLPQVIPFAKSQALSVNIPTNNIGKIDLYIDDNTAIILEEKDNVKRVTNAILTAIRAVSRPLNLSDQIHRNDIISQKKFQAEGSPSETKKS
jgi:hypothetical protein